MEWIEDWGYSHECSFLRCKQILGHFKGLCILFYWHSSIQPELLVDVHLCKSQCPYRNRKPTWIPSSLLFASISWSKHVGGSWGSHWETIASGRKAVKRLGNLVTVSNSLGKRSQLTFSYRHIQTDLQRLNCLRILTFQSSMLRIMYLMILSKRVLFTTIPLNFLNNYMAHSRFGTSGEQISRTWHLKWVNSFGYFYLILTTILLDPAKWTLLTRAAHHAIHWRVVWCRQTVTASMLSRVIGWVGRHGVRYSCMPSEPYRYNRQTAYTALLSTINNVNWSLLITCGIGILAICSG